MKYQWNTNEILLSSIKVLVVYNISSPHNNTNLTNKNSRHEHALISKYSSTCTC